MSERWSFWIDRGGTFTDVVARDPQGALQVHKLLSEDPGRYDDAAVEGIRRLLGGELDASRIEGLRMGTTVATNALLERHGARVCLVITAGFEDLLAIGTQARPDLFALRIVQPETLSERVIGLDERVLASGEVRRAPDLERLGAQLRQARADGIEALAVVLANAYAHPDHELAVGRLAAGLGFAHVALSHQTVGELGLTGRGDTTTADAYLTPILRDYVDRVRRQLDGEHARVPLRFMQSSGGLADAAHFSGKDAVLSGPAGGVVACAHVARQASLRKVIGFDMGGTSTDVCRVDIDEGFERVFERVVAGVRLKAPMLNVITIAAGGGSLLQFDGRRLTVGPESAGADPGPACYRREGGRLAVTDANAALGRVQPAFFPACFGEAGDQPLDPEASVQALSDLAREVARASGKALSVPELAAGFVRIANDDMARAIREISVARGYDVSEYALCCFGGAGAQHACAVARLLGMKRVVLDPLAGVLSAYGMGLADVVHANLTAILRPLEELSVEALEAAFGQLEREGRAAVEAQGVLPGAIRCLRAFELRYQGVDATLHVPAPDDPGRPALQAAFAEQHRRLYGFDRPGHPIELVNLRLETVGAGHGEGAPPPDPEAREVAPDEAVTRVAVWFERLVDGIATLEQVDTPVYRRAALEPGARLRGPALIVEQVSTVVVDPGWDAELNGAGILVLHDRAGRGRERLSTERDPVFLEIMGNLYMSIAEQMGLTLQRVSLSVNIKERLDFSCAIFDGAGGLVANAPHIPVHLGAMSESVRAVLASRGDDVQPGDVYLTNDPFHGGSHLPDVTVITPVFTAGPRPTFFVASRGHHADVGGVVPGSMPPFSRSIDEEGVRLHDFLLVRQGALRREEILAELSRGPYPVRGQGDMLADLEAQVAANAQGVRLLEEMVGHYGQDVVAAYMQHVQDDAAAAMREAIAALPDGEHRFEDYLDEGARIAVTITITGDRAHVDFAGTDPRLAGNLNAPRAVVRAAMLYVFRTLIDRPVPLNSGCFRPLELSIPDGCLLSPEAPDAVVGGNVETSQRVVDVLYGALGKLAAAQGTMNNLTFGNADFGYYETICGGAGAGLGFDGASGVHTHMTNTRITDPEVLERRFPVVVRRFALRPSGGAGVFRGGDGVVRELEFLAPVTAAVLSERRGLRPYGLHGGRPGQRGRNSVQRDGSWRDVPGKVRLQVAPGDALRVETPGGGGYDPTPAEWAAMPAEQARRLFRDQRWTGPTSGIALRHVQANLVVVPQAVADDFEAYCRANPRPCPLLERLAAGDPRVRRVARADLRHDLPRYRRYTGPRTWEERLDVAWADDAVGFLLGCSFSLEGALQAAGLPVRHVDERRNVPMYRTTRQTEAVGPFGGELVVSMRPLRPDQVQRAHEVTEALWFGHGAPIHHGDPAELGITDLGAPEWGQAVTVGPDEVPVFWACGVTSQVALEGALERGELTDAVTHAPGHMMLCDVTVDELLRAPRE